MHEILFVLGGLCYSIGASINGYKESGPNVQEIKQA